MLAELRTFDGLDNRKALIHLCARLGEGLPEFMQRERRAQFLRSLLPASRNGFSDKDMRVTPCSAAEMYHFLVAITGCLGVSIEWAAKRLETAVRRQ